MQTPDERIRLFFKYLQKAFKNANIRIKFPKDTDPTKTYTWRYLKHFAEKVDEWGVSDETAYKLIDAITDYSKKHKLLNRGVSILASDKILEIGYEAIKGQVQMEDNIYHKLGLDRKIIESINGSKVTMLLKREPEKALPNIVKWYTQGKLSTLYIALSKSCGAAMASLNSFERSFLPPIGELLDIKQKCLKNAIVKNKIKFIFGDDWANGI